MAYAIKYLFKFESSNGTTREIRVLQDGYTGEVIQRPLGRAPVLKKQQNGPVHGTSLEFYAECNVDREFIEFYTSDPKAYRVDLYAGATLLWQGYITPELYSEPDIAPPYDVQVVATDGVGELKLYDYAAQGTVTLRALLSGLLARTGLGTDIYLISSLKAGSRGAGALLDMTINLDYMAGESCYDVLTYLLDTLHATITWWKGAWILTRETNVTFTSGKVRYFNTAGNSALLADSVQMLGSLRANPAWPVGQLSTVIDPAKNRVTVQAPWHVVTCLQNPDMGSDADWVKAKNARYETDGYVLPININTGTSETAVISQATSMAGLRVPMNLSVKATGATSEISAQAYGTVIGVLLTYKVGGVTYHLVKGTDGTPAWQQGDDIGTYIPLRTRVDFQQQLATWDSSRIEAEELTIENIPPFLQGTAFPAGTLTVYILGYCAKIYGAYLDVVLSKGYQDVLRIDNGARGEGSEVEIAIGRETADNAYYAAFLQGLLLDSGNLITSFSDANFPGGMDYLAFIARDYALSVALPRAKVTGTVYLESGIAAPPLVFTKGALNYWLQTWSWNLYEDELEIEGLTLPSASLTVESETILESTASTSSSSGRTSGGGAPISPGTSMAAVQEWVNSQGYLASVEAASTYATITALNGVSSRVTTLEGRTNWDTYFGVDENGDIYVKKNGNTARNFYSWGAVSASGLSSGGGSEGASLAAVWASLKTNSDEFANEKINAYHIPIGSGLSVVNGLIVANNAGTVTSVKVGTATYNPTDGVVSLPAYPTTLPASDVYAWAKKPALDASDVPTLAISKISGLQTALDAKASASDLSGLTERVTTDEAILDEALASLQSQIDSVSARNNYDELTATTLYSDAVSVGSMFVLGGNILTWDEDNSAWHLNGNFYADGFISAGGASSGGGAAGIDLTAMWSSLTNNPADSYASTKIAAAHIPDMASTYGYAYASALSAYQTKYAFTINGASGATYNLASFVTSSGVTSVATGTGLTGGTITGTGTISISGTYQTYIANGNTAYGWGNHANAGYASASNLTALTTRVTTDEGILDAALQSLQSQIDSVSACNNFDEITAAAVFGDMVSGSSGYFDDLTLGEYSMKAIPNAYLANSAITINGVAVSLGGTRTITQAQLIGTSSVGSASVPVWYNGSALTAITPSSMFSVLSSSAATNLSVTIAGQNRTATLYATYDSASENIANNMTTIGTALKSLQSQIDAVSARNGFDELYATAAYADVLSVGTNIDAGGNIVAIGAVTAGSASSRLLKQNIRTMTADYAKRIVLNSRPVTFEWNALATSLYDQYKGADIGMVAEETEGLLPMAVGRIWEKYKRLDYTKFVAPLVCVAQDHERRIRELEKENKELKRRLNVN